GFAGRIETEKGLQDVVSALAHLPDSVVLVAVGSGDHQDMLRKTAADLGVLSRLHLVPRVDDGEMGAYLYLFDILVVPSHTTSTWKEQFGRVIPEAMACGALVVGSSSGAIPEVIGDAGWIYPEGRPERLAQTILSLLSQDEATLDHVRRT